jgi:F-box/leucine-rich repeat protein 2/20
MEDVNVSASGRISDTGFADLLRRCPRLHNVNIGCEVTIITCEGLDRLGDGGKALKRLHSSSTSITDAGLAKLAKACVNLEHLDLTSCSMITNDGLATLAQSCNSLQSLHLTGTAISEAGLNEIGDGFEYLEKLLIYGVPLTDSGLGKFGTACPELEHIGLCGSQLTETGVTHLAERCSHLRIVEITDKGGFD